MIQNTAAIRLYIQRQPCHSDHQARGHVLVDIHGHSPCHEVPYHGWDGCGRKSSQEFSWLVCVHRSRYEYTQYLQCLHHGARTNTFNCAPEMGWKLLPCVHKCGHAPEMAGNMQAQRILSVIYSCLKRADPFCLKL